MGGNQTEKICEKFYAWAMAQDLVMPFGQWLTFIMTFKALNLFL
jgi:hypothetical protein